MSTINIKNLTFSYDGSHDNIFENVSLQINTDWKLGLVGRNGKGKTTLLKLLLGELNCGGNIQSSDKFEYFPFHIPNAELTVSEIIDNIDPNNIEWKINRELNLLDLQDFDLYRQFSSYSNGEQTKILLAVLFAKENTFLLIDEPTNHLDRKGREVLAKYLNRKSNYIIVSHDKRFLDNCIDHVMSINRSNIEIQSGNMSSFLENKSRQDAYELSENERLKAEITRLTESTRRTKSWADKSESTKIGFDPNEVDNKVGRRAIIGGKTKKMMSAAKSIENRNDRAIEKKSSLLKNIDREDSLKIERADFFVDKLLVVQSLIVTRDGIGVNKPISFEICQGDRICVVGKNGCGKTSIIKAILRQLEYVGTINYNRQLKISYVAQDTSSVKGSIDEFCTANNIDKTILLSTLTKLGFNRIQFDKPMQYYSEGQKKKVLIAKSLSEKANLYIWDEPLNYIDIISRDQIKKMLLASDVTMLFVEHDADFCDEVSTEILEMQ